MAACLMVGASFAGPIGAIDAHADGMGLVTVDAEPSPVSRQQLQRAVRDALRGRRSPVRDAVGAARRRLTLDAVPLERLREFRRARELSDEGWRAYLAVNRSFAASRLGEARRIAEHVLDLAGGRALMADISLRLAAVVMDLGRAQQSRDLYRLARMLAPHRAVTVAEFSPDVVAAYQRITHASDARATATVEISVAGAGVGAAQLSVDGGPWLDAPRSAHLTEGQHVLVARRGGARSRGRIFSVSVAGTSTLSVDLEEDPWVSALQRPVAGMKPGLEEVPASLAAEALVVYGELDELVLVAAVWRRGLPALLGQLCAGVPVRCGPVAEVGFPAAAALDNAARNLVASLVAAGTNRGFPLTLLEDRRLAAAEHAPRDGHNSHGGNKRGVWWRSPYLWIGVGVSALTVGAVVLLGRDQEIRPVVVGDPCSFISCR